MRDQGSDNVWPTEQRHDSAASTKNNEWKQAKLLVVFSIPGEDIWSDVAKRMEFGITEAMLQDPLKKARGPRTSRKRRCQRKGVIEKREG